MHGRQGGGGEDYADADDHRKPRPRGCPNHMWPIPAALTTTLDSNSNSNPNSNSNSIRLAGTDYFFKDGRKISVGDCALFKPPQDTSPPFIGIIRWLSSGKDNHLKLGVNWLYRPPELKLNKGILLEAAPNEIFYSFHEDEIHAASLLHPCKVAFLRKGVKLPSGVSSFVCRRVYDINNQCLWWLTDKDYINERQEEVDQLLGKTRLEMHAAVQPGGRSPKPLNVPTSATQLKPGSDSVQNSSSSFPSQVKGKKRERGDQGSEPIKRERYVKTDDGDSGQCRPESMLKSEIAKITDKGGLVECEGVEKLVQLMQPDRAERKIDLASRIALVDVIAATDRYECLGQFVQLRGLSVLDEWLQEVHKGKISDSISPKESDKSVEEFLFALLRALDKLPVNLHALQTCNVGKSVNHLRSHKNLEIQKKARSLVDTWKKRVEAEMKINDAKSGSSHAVSWPNKPGFEVSQGGNRRMGVSSDVPMKSSFAQPSANKTAPVKFGQGEGSSKSASPSPGSAKLSTSLPASVAVSSKDLKEERSSSSSQSQNNSQSCSSDHIKTVGSVWKEDARSSTAGSPNVNKASSGGSRHRRSSNGILGAAVSGVQKETSFVKSGSLNRSVTSEKVSQSGITCDRTLETPNVDQGNSHRLIVKFSNHGRSPARSATGVSHYDPSVMVSGASSPGLSEKNDHYERKVKGMSDSCRPNVASDVNTESWQSNDVKDGFAGSDEGDGSPATVLDEDRCRSGEEMGKPLEASKATCSSTGNEKGVLSSGTKSGKSGDATLNSITALIESCVKYSEANACISAGDDGMNLLASVAAGEMSKSDLGSPVGTPARNSPVPEESHTGSESKSRLAGEDVASQSHRQSSDGADGNTEKHGSANGPPRDEDHVIGDNKNTSSFPEEKPRVGSSSTLQRNSEPCSKFDREPDDKKAAATSCTVNDEDGEVTNHLHGNTKMSVDDTHKDDIHDQDLKVKISSSDENKKFSNAEGKLPERNVTAMPDVHGRPREGCNIEAGAAGVKDEDEAEAIKESPSCTALEMDDRNKKPAHEGVTCGIPTGHRLDPGVMNRTEAIEQNGDNAALASNTDKVLKLDCGNGLTSEVVTRMEAKIHEEPRELKKTVQTCDVAVSCNGQINTGAHSVSDKNDEGIKVETDSHEVVEHTGGSVLQEELLTVPVQETGLRSSGSKGSIVGGNETEECVSKAEASSVSTTEGLDVGTKLDFDLNETMDDGNQGEPVFSMPPGCLSSVHLSSPLLFPVPSMTSSLPASVTVASAAKGSFVPPENPLKNTGQLGWKGSAATSAFRPARKVLEMPLNTTDVHPDTPPIKHDRPSFDLNDMPDERAFEDMASQSSAPETHPEVGRLNCRDLGRGEMVGSSSASVRGAAPLDLDLNRVGEDTDNGQVSASTIRRLGMPLLPDRSASSGLFHNGEVNVMRNFDLNNGPAHDEVVPEPVQRNQHARSTFPSIPPVGSSYRMSNSELGSLSSWFTPGNQYPTVTFPSVLPDRGEQPFPIVATAGMQRILGGPPTGGPALGPDVFRPVLSSSPAMGFTPGNQFPYPGFPFSSNFPIPSTTFSGVSTTYMDSSAAGGLCFPAVPSQLVGPGGAVSSHYPRPYVINLPDGSSSGGAETSRKWVRPGLDLNVNVGPGGADIDGRDERFPSTSRQLPVANSHALIEEQMRLYQAAGGGLKRKEPEGGWDVERFSYKQPSWQ